MYARIAENLQATKPDYPFPRPVETLGLIYYDPITEVDRVDKIHSGGFLMEFRACWSPVARLDALVDVLIERAWSILSRPTPPPAHPTCEACAAYRRIASVITG
ncbi:MAG: hypothetical protein CFK49_07630 [Armatimonadetes bacterium JP3_11]|nr:MAG: hypothetical protein CFK49_07630 [Armatimonadetes bacterium JP3_11]RMH09831.1 MAG: hypothetical protein D6697_02495 [Armatimonadota bacterium]